MYILEILSNPDFTESITICKKSIMNKYTLVIIGSCKVIYEGRASSTLGYGERIVILKQDGSTLIHRPTGYKPVNWQPSGASIISFATELVENEIESAMKNSISLF